MSEEVNMNKKKRDNTISLVVVVIVVIALMVTARVENDIRQDGGSLRISGIYGTTLQKEDIESVALTDSMPRIERRINGASIMSIHKGIYRLAGITRTRLYIHTAGGPYLRINSVDQVIFINYRDVQKTQTAYADIVAWLE
jgi:hypothetical protein